MPRAHTVGRQIPAPSRCHLAIGASVSCGGGATVPWARRTEPPHLRRLPWLWAPLWHSAIGWRQRAPLGLQPNCHRCRERCNYYRYRWRFGQYGAHVVHVECPMAQPYFSMQLCQIATIVPLWARMGMHVQVRVGLSVGMAAQVCRDQYHEQSRSRSETETKRHLEHLLAQWAMQARSSTVGIVSPTTGRVWVRSGLVWGKRSVLGARGSVTIANHSREWLTFAHAPRALIASCTAA